MNAETATGKTRKKKSAGKGPSHRWELREAHCKGLLQGVIALLQPGDIVIDCGANLGEISAPLLASGAHVHAFEPDPFNFAKLTERFAGVANITLHNAAVATKAGTIRLMRAENWQANPELASVSSTIVPGGRRIEEGEGIDVAMIDFPAFVQDLVARHGRVAFLKMDIEGAELDLLEEMDRQDLFKGIALTVAETHEKKFKHLAGRFAALRASVAGKYPVTKVNLDWI